MTVARFQLQEIDTQFQTFSAELLLHWINEGNKKLATISKPFKGMVEIDLSDESSYQMDGVIPPPSDFMELILSHYKKGQDYFRLEKADREWLNTYITHDADKEGEPVFYYLFGNNKIKIYPRPVDGYLILTYFRYPQKATLEDDLETLAGFEDAPVDYALYRALATRRSPRANDYYQLYSQHLMHARQEARDRETHGQEHISTIYQEDDQK